MWIFAMTLWVIDVRNIVAVINLTLLPKTAETLDDAYQVALYELERLEAATAVLYGYMVSKSRLAATSPRTK